VIQRLATSGFSVVYEAHDQVRGNRVALKVLSTGGSDAGWVRDQFAREVAALRSIEHQGVVRVLNSWITQAGEPCLTMEFLVGPTLRAVIRLGPVSPERAARMIRQLAEALAAVHGRGIVHRDLKPENVILLHAGTPAEQAILIDFGTAAFRGAGNELAGTTLVAASFQYVPPERLTGYYAPASDTYSLAAVIFEIITGKPIGGLCALFSDPDFQDKVENAISCVLPPAVASHLAERISPAFDPVPKRRPVDVADWATGIAALLEAAEVDQPAIEGRSHSQP
jgi:serine/threonine-protein kinase